MKLIWFTGLLAIVITGASLVDGFNYTVEYHHQSVEASTPKPHWAEWVDPKHSKYLHEVSSASLNDDTAFQLSLPHKRGGFWFQQYNWEGPRGWLSPNGFVAPTNFLPCPMYCGEYRAADWPMMALYNTDLDPSWAVHAEPITISRSKSAFSRWKSAFTGTVDAELLVTFHNVPPFLGPKERRATNRTLQPNLTAQIHFFANDTVVMRYQSVPPLDPRVIVGMVNTPTTSVLAQVPTWRAKNESTQQDELTIEAIRFEWTASDRCQPDVGVHSCGTCIAQSDVCGFCSATPSASLVPQPHQEPVVSPTCVPIEHLDLLCPQASQVSPLNETERTLTRAALVRAALTKCEDPSKTTVAERYYHKEIFWKNANSWYRGRAGDWGVVGWLPDPSWKNSSVVLGKRYTLPFSFPAFYNPVGEKDPTHDHMFRSLFVGLDGTLSFLYADETTPSTRVTDPPSDGGLLGRPRISFSCLGASFNYWATNVTVEEKARVPLIRRSSHRECAIQITVAGVAHCAAHVVFRYQLQVSAVPKAQATTANEFVLAAMFLYETGDSILFFPEIESPIFRIPALAIHSGSSITVGFKAEYIVTPSANGHPAVKTSDVAGLIRWEHLSIGSVATLKPIHTCPICLNGGTCSQDTNYECQCKHGFKGVFCSSCAEGYYVSGTVTTASGTDKVCSLCLRECSNGGKCDMYTGKCRCANGWDGDVCTSSCNSTSIGSSIAGGVTGEMFISVYRSVPLMVANYSSYCSVDSCNTSFGFCSCGQCYCSPPYRGRLCADLPEENTPSLPDQVTTTTPHLKVTLAIVFSSFLLFSVAIVLRAHLKKNRQTAAGQAAGAGGAPALAVPGAAGGGPAAPPAPIAAPTPASVFAAKPLLLGMYGIDEDPVFKGKGLLLHTPEEKADRGHDRKPYVSWTCNPLAPPLTDGRRRVEGLRSECDSDDEMSESELL